MSQTPPARTEVVARCPHCRKKTPEINAEVYGENETSVMTVFILQCCKSIVGCQLLAKQPNMRTKDDGEMLPPV